MISLRKTALLLAALLAVPATGLVAEEKDESSAADREAIQEVYETFSRAYRELDADLVANLYTEDAHYLVPNRPIRQGRAEIRASFARMFDRTRATNDSLSIRFSFERRVVSGDVAYDVGIYHLEGTARGGWSSRGKFVTVLERGEDGRWRFTVDGYSDLEPPQD